MQPNLPDNPAAMPLQQRAKDRFIDQIERRQEQGKTTTFEALATRLREHYSTLDNAARRAFAKSALRMFANYENKWTGYANVLTGQWVEPTASGNDVNLTVPLLTAHVDTAIVNYTKTKPEYKGMPFINTELNRKLARMCAVIAHRELKRMLTFSDLQREAQYMALATLSYRNIKMDYRPDSPIIFKEVEQTQDVPMIQLTCTNCQYTEKIPAMELSSGDTQGAINCPECLSPKIQVIPQTDQQQVKVKVPVRLPRPVIEIPNPVNVQRDFNAMTFRKGKFVIVRRRVPKKTAEFYYQIDLTGANSSTAAESIATSQMAREPIRNDNSTVPLFDIGGYVTEQNELIEETHLWLDPSEYGLFFADSQMLGAVYPHGLYILMCGDLVIRKRSARLDIEWVGLQQGMRPASNGGTGMVHLADMNEVINNCLSLDYAVLRTHGFPLRILRERYLSALPQASQTLLATKIPDDVPLDAVIHTEQPSNTSGMVGIIPQIMQQHMSFIAGTFNPMDAGNGAARDMLGSATGAAALEGMMNSRQGLNLQMRLEADIDTMYSILYFLQQDDRNRELFIEEFDEATVDAFFKSTDLRSSFYFEPVRGTDEPQSESANAFKMITFAQNIAPLTGLHEYDKETFYDLVAKLGDSLNIDVEIGAGRKERNLADNKITRIKELYKEYKNDPMLAQATPIDIGCNLYQAVTMKDVMVVSSIAQALAQKEKVATAPIINEVQAMAASMVQAPPVEIYLYDWDALVVSYSDWLQSDEGQNAAIPVQLAVGMLFAYAQEMKEQKEWYEKLKMASMIPAPEDPNAPAGQDSGTSSGSTKKDGKAAGSTGRPRQPSASRYAEGKTRETAK